MTINPRQVASVRAKLLDQVSTLRARILAHMENGNRDFMALGLMVAEYGETLTAADVLSGQTSVVP